MTDLLTGIEVENPTLAKKTKRCIAVLLDYLFFWLLNFMLGFVLGESYSIDTAGGYTWGFNLSGLPTLFSAGIWLLIFPVSEAVNGQTPGKMLLKIKVVTIQYAKASFGQTLVRHLFDIIDYLPFLGILGIIVASSTGYQQRVGDLVAGTIVVNSQPNTGINEP
ncbi:MAG: hypothetical protein RL172_705 [Bacteroidota bacterium]|jgi:uncharacterized RDD family membrane protein YckC